MTRILVSPDQLISTASLFQSQRNQLERICNSLDRQVYFLEQEWSGVTTERFYSEYWVERESLKVTLSLMGSIAQELNFIAKNFSQVDGGEVTIVMPSLSPETEAKLAAAQNALEDAKDGAIDQLKEIWGDVENTTKAVWEAPFRTLSGIAYGLTIGKAVDVGMGVGFAWDYFWGTGTARNDVDQFVENSRQELDEKGAGYFAGSMLTQAGSYFIFGKALRNEKKHDDLGGYEESKKEETDKEAGEKSDKEINLSKDTLSKKAIKHPLNDHMPLKYSKQLEYQSREDVENYLSKKSFFNPNWTESQVIDALNEGYKDAMSHGVQNGYHVIEIYGETVQVYIRNGRFSTGFGTHKLAYEDLVEISDKGE